VMRLFYCVELDQNAREALGRLIEELRRRLPQGKWVPPGNLHLTVRFLGEVEEEQLPGLLELGQRVAAESEPSSLILKVISAFPSPRRARVLWVGPLDGDQGFLDLCRRVEAGVRALGFPPETKEPRAHVTLVRFRRPQDLSPYLGDIQLEALDVPVQVLTLMRSELRPEGARYTPIERWELGGG